MQPISSQGDSVIKVKSLPYDACQLDVLMFFDGFKMRPNGVQLVIQGNNKPSGEVITAAVCCICLSWCKSCAICNAFAAYRAVKLQLLML